MTTIYEELKQDHDRHRRLLAELDGTSGAGGARKTLFHELKQEIGAHAAAEEQTFYATLIAAPEGQPKARHSVHEHKTAADLLDELAELDFGSGGWLRKFRKLKEELEHHMDEEEREVFKRARKIISATRAEELSGTFRRRKSSELQ
jgi:iron-sulfur cluster repair protein YtfE (RIC family)